MEENTQSKTILRHNALKTDSAVCLHPRGMTMRVCPHKQQLHWYLSALVALSPPKPVTKSSLCYNRVLIPLVRVHAQ